MSQSKSSFAQKVLVGVFCAIFLIVSAIPVLGAPKKPKKDETDTPVASEEPAIGTLAIVLEPSNAQREVGGKVRVHIYADSADTLISMGVKVTYDKNVLHAISAEKYTAFGDGWIMDADGSDATTDDQYTTPAVEIDNTNGTVTMIGGRLMGSSTAGLSGKVMLGWIVFEAIANGTSNLNVDLAKYHPNDPTDTFDNFVTVGGIVDNPTNVPGDLGVICVLSGAHPGDINNNGWVEPGDYAILRSHMYTGFPDPAYNVLADLNGNGWVEPGDYAILRAHMNTQCLVCPPSP